MWKSDMILTDRQFTVKIDHVEHWVLDKVKEIAEETRRKAKQVLHETEVQTNKLKQRLELWLL